MSLLSDIGSALSRLFDTDRGLARQVVYQPAGGAPIEIPAVINFGEDLDDSDWGSRLYAAAVICIQDSDLPGAPVYQDLITIDGEEWRVSRILSRNTGIWVLEIHSDLRMQPGGM